MLLNDVTTLMAKRTVPFQPGGSRGSPRQRGGEAPATSAPVPWPFPAESPEGTVRPRLQGLVAPGGPEPVPASAGAERQLLGGAQRRWGSLVTHWGSRRPPALRKAQVWSVTKVTHLPAGTDYPLQSSGEFGGVRGNGQLFFSHEIYKKTTKSRKNKSQHSQCVSMEGEQAGLVHSMVK